jgi:hypothetical protein
MEQKTRKKLFVLATAICGIAAAYLMYRRGESLGKIAVKTITNPMGTLASEVGNAVRSGSATKNLNPA